MSTYTVNLREQMHQRWKWGSEVKEGALTQESARKGTKDTESGDLQSLTQKKKVNSKQSGADKDATEESILV